jgi:hypothetical protein
MLDEKRAKCLEEKSLENVSEADSVDEALSDDDESKSKKTIKTK